MPNLRRFLIVLVLFSLLVAIFIPLQFLHAAETPPSPKAVVYQTSSLQFALADGQFVYGPNAYGFDVQGYINTNAPHLAKYADTIYRRSEYYSINPRLYLTLMEMATGLVSNPQANIEDPFRLSEQGFVRQLELISEQLNASYYQYLYGVSPLNITQRPNLSVDFQTGSLPVDKNTNAGTYALLNGLGLFTDSTIAQTWLASNGSFYQTWTRLFPNNDPLDQSNRIFIPGEPDYLNPPVDMLQLPYQINDSWLFNGVHNEAGSGGSDMASLDFSPGWPVWNVDTSNMWVVAAESGVPFVVSPCNVRITHADGWETRYYHLENVQTLGNLVTKNQRLAVIANTQPEALCDGGSSTGPHVHFTTKRNGAWVPLDATALSGWVVHAGIFPYDSDPTRMWLIRDGTQKYAGDLLLNDHPAITPTAMPAIPPATFLLYPSHRTRINYTQPYFEWGLIPGYTQYRIIIYLEDGTRVAQKVVAGTSYWLSTPLAPGKYLWRVRTKDPITGVFGKMSKRNTLFIDLNVTPTPFPTATPSATPAG